MTVHDPTRIAIEAFVLGENMRTHVDRDDGAWWTLLREESQRIASLPDLLLHGQLADPNRLARFLKATWSRETIRLEACWVWPQMRGWSVASGRVPDVAAMVLQHPDQGQPAVDTKTKLLAMRDKVSRFSDDLPLLVFRPPGIHHGYPRDTHPMVPWYDLDDGSSRAVALWLAGKREALALIGTLR